MSVFIASSNVLHVRCGSCGKEYIWSEHCTSVPFSTGAGPSLQHRISHEVRCPGCNGIEAKWNLAKPTSMS